MLGTREIRLGRNKDAFWVSPDLQNVYFDRQPIIWPTAFGDEWAIISQGEAPPPLAFLGIGAAGGAFMLFQLLRGEAAPEGKPAWMTALLGLFVMMVGFYAYFALWQKYRQSKRFGSPILLLEHDKYLPGEALTIGFHRDMLPEVKVEAGSSLSAWLVGMELTRRVQGTDTNLDRVIFHEQELGKKSLVSGTNQLRASWHLQLPDNARPTLLQEAHWVVWLVQVRQSLPGQLEEVTDFFIPVVAQRSGGR